MDWEPTKSTAGSLGAGVLDGREAPAAGSTEKCPNSTPKSRAAEPGPPPRSAGQGEEQFGGSMSAKSTQTNPGWMGIIIIIIIRLYISSSGSVLGAGLARTQIRAFSCAKLCLRGSGKCRNGCNSSAQTSTEPFVHSPTPTAEKK